MKQASREEMSGSLFVIGFSFIGGFVFSHV